MPPILGPDGRAIQAAAAPAQAQATTLSGGPAPGYDLSTGLTFRDMGSYGLKQWGGWVREEFLPQLRGQQGARTYREMLDNSAVVSGIMFAITQMMRMVEWRAEPANDSASGTEAAEFVDSLRDDMSHSWDDFITEQLSMLGYGYAVHEIIYKRRDGPQPNRLPDGQPNPVAGSKFNDGQIGWRRLPIRGQETILKWFFSESGQILGVTQQPWTGGLVDIPIEKMLLFRPQAHKNNPEGRSILRPAYRPWYFIKRLEEQEAIIFERMGGLPTIYVPSTLLEAAALGDVQARSKLDAYKRIVTNLRIDEQMGVILPSDPWMSATGPTAAMQYKFELTAPNAGRSGSGNSAGQSIDRYNLDILMTVLADFLRLGHDARGTQSLAVTKTDMFFQAVQGWSQGSTADTLNRHAIPRLWELNARDPEEMPEFKPDMPRRVDLDAMSSYILRLSQAGMPLFPEEELEEYVRDIAGLPDRPEGGVQVPEGPDLGDQAGAREFSQQAARAEGGDQQAQKIVKEILAMSMLRRVHRHKANGRWHGFPHGFGSR